MMYQMKKVCFSKKVFLVFISAILMMACGNAQNNNSNNHKNENKMKAIHLTKDDFLKKVANYETSPNEWKYLGDKPAIVDFYATWCGPCKMVAPVLEELAQEYGDSIYIYKVDTDQEQEVASAFGIRSIPSLLFIPLHGAPQMLQGALPKAELKRAIDTILLNKL